MTNIIKTNKYQTEVTQELVDTLPTEVFSNLLEYIETVELIATLINPNVKTIETSAKDDNGLVIVDITSPHMLENMDYFREAALHFQKYGKYTLLTPNAHPKSPYKLHWKEEKKRCLEGFSRPDGEWIPGDLYFYWNYCPIMLTKQVGNTKKALRVKDFPKPWLGDYLFFHYKDQADKAGKHIAVIKMRGVGASFKAGEIGIRRTVLMKNQKTFYTAYDKQFLNQDGVLNKAWNYLDFLAENTPFPRMRLKDSLNRMELRMGYKDLDTNAEKGSKGEIIGISSKDDPDKIRGKRGTIYFEEFGKFPKLSDTWNVCRDSTEDGGVAYDMLVAMGCVCAGTKIYTKDGKYINIEDLKQSDGILGFNVDDEIQAIQTITNMNPPAKKQCVEIKTKQRTLRCSSDHPILVRNKYTHKTNEPNGIRRDYYAKLDKWYETIRYKNKDVYKKEWKKAGDIVNGDTILVSEGIDLWGDIELFDPRLVGMLIGDGSYGMRLHYGKPEFKTPSFSNCDDELNDYVEENYPHTVCLTRPTQDDRIYKEISIRGLIPRLKEIGIAGQSKKQKRLPTNYMNLTKNHSALLLAGLFDTDGHVCIKGKKSRAVIGFTQSSEELTIQTKELLEKFGITSTIRKQEPNLKKKTGILDRNPWYVLTICNKKSLRNFYKNIPLLIKYKQNHLKEIYDTSYKTEVRKNNSFNNIIEEKIISTKKIGKQVIYI